MDGTSGIQAQPVIIDTDFGLLDTDGIACLTAIGSPSLDVLGLTIVAGDDALPQELEDARRFLELIDRPDIAVCAGFDRPLVHERGVYEDQLWGGWASERALQTRAGARAELPLSTTHAVDFIIEQAEQRPGELVLIALGPLTNVAIAFRKHPPLNGLLKRIVCMGGAVPGLPRGHGNQTPTAEFNFWVDAEAARIVLRAGADLLLCPLNVTRRAKFDGAVLERALAAGSGGSRLLETFLAPHFRDESAARPDLIEYGLCDTVAIAAAIDDAIFDTVDLYADIDTTQGMTYGTIHGYVLETNRDAVGRGAAWAWTGMAQPDHPLGPAGAAPVTVAFDVDLDALLDRFVEGVAGV
jgi:inosine-uridine nucleoside N-ribohydrolase